MAVKTHSPKRMTDPDWLVWLALKPSPKLIGKTCCVERQAGPDDDRRTERCTRPVWGNDGRVDGVYHGYCSKHWHEWNAFHGAPGYTTMQANPAAAKLDLEGIRRLTFNSLPDLGAERPDTFPADWL